MNTVLAHNHFFSGRLFSLIGLCLCVYFSYHLLTGERSIYTWGETRRILEQQEEVLSSLQFERESMESQVKMLRVGSINVDFLEERAREVLGVASPDEFVMVGIGADG